MEEASEILSRHPSDMTEEELRQAPRLSARKQYEEYRANRDYLIPAQRYEEWLEQALWTSQQNAKAFDADMHKLLDDFWGLVYPGETHWDYPGMVFSHVRIYIRECRSGEHPLNGDAS